MKYIINCWTFENKLYYLNWGFDLQEELSDNVLWNYEDIDFERLEKESKKYHFKYKIEEF